MRLHKGNSASIITAITLSVAAFAIVACDTPFSKDDNASVANYAKSAGGSGSGIGVFTSGFYAFATKNCVQCHGSSQAPLFAVSDINTAYAAAKSVANLADPSSSELAIYAGNGHCGVSNCNGQTATVIPLLQAWAAAEANPSSTSTGTDPGAGLAAPSAGIAYFTTPVTIPANIPGAGNTFSIMRWPLSNLSPTNSLVTGGYFELQIQLLTPTSYRITMPKLAVKNSTIVTSVHVMIKPSTSAGNGQEDPLAMDWSTINVNVPAFNVPATLPTASFNVTALTGDSMVLPVLSASDQIIIGFDAFGVGTNETACSNLMGTNGFVSNVLPQMTSICFNCHLAGGSGNAAFPMVNNNNTALCASTLAYINLNNPSGSQIVVNPQGNNGHPNVGGGFDPTPFIEWIESE